MGRVATETNGKTVAWTSDGVDPVYATAGSRKDAFIRDAYGELIGERTSADGIGWYIQDALSSIYGVTVASGAVLPDVTDYGDFGLQHKDTRFNFTYTGQRADMSNNGLVNYYARAYNPMTATWMQADRYRGEISGPNTLHRYLFVGANPTTLIDALASGCWRAWRLVRSLARYRLSLRGKYSRGSRRPLWVLRQKLFNQRQARLASVLQEAYGRAQGMALTTLRRTVSLLGR